MTMPALFIMRVTEINIGYDFNGDIVSTYKKWNRDHTVMTGGDIYGDAAMTNFIDNIREDGYCGKQLIKIQSNRQGRFSSIKEAMCQSDLELLAKHVCGNNVDLVIKQ